MPLSHYSLRFHQILDSGRLLAVDKGETIVTTENIHAVYCVKEGFVKRFLIKNDGSLSVQGIYGPGDCFGMTALSRLLLRQDTYSGAETYYYAAINAVTVCEVEDLILQDSLSKYPELYKDFFTIQGWHSLSDVWHLENQGISSADKRVAHIICYYMERYGVLTDRGWECRVPFIQQDLADILDLSRETISLAITDLKKRGLLREARKISVPSIDRLKDEAYS